MKTLCLLCSLLLAPCSALVAGPAFFAGQQGVVASGITPPIPVTSFDPDDYGTTKHWFSIRSEPVLPHGSSITNWTDTINGWVLGQATLSARATYSTNVIGSYPGAFFDGVNDYYTASSSAMLDVIRNVASATVMVLVVPSRTGTSGSTNPVFTYRRNSISSSRLVLASNSGGQYFGVTARPDDAVSGASASEGSSFTVGTPYVVTVQALFSSGTVDIYRDTTQTATASYTAATTSNTASAEIGFGSGSAGFPGFWQGYTMEWICWVPALSSTQLTNAVTDLRSYYELP